MKKTALNYLPQLVKFGLSKHEIKTYLILLEKGSLPVKEIAKEVEALPNALYRLLNKLMSSYILRNI